MKGAETAVKWKEVKGHAGKLSGKTCKGSKVRVMPRTLRGKGDERTGRGARWPAVSRQRVNPATGRDRAAGQSPVGLTFRYKAARPMPPTMRRTCADHTPTMRRPCSDHAHTFCTGPTFIRGEGFADWLRRFPRIFVAFPRSVQKRVQKQVFLGGA